MPADVTELAVARVKYQQRVAERAARSVLASWELLSRGELEAQWRRTAPRVKLALVTSQRLAALGAQEYVESALSAQGAGGSSLALVPADALAGYAMDGRSLEGALAQPFNGVRDDLARGHDRAEALRRGEERMLRLVAGELGDTARTADGLAIGLEETARGYVRRVNVPSCGRCIVLAGKFFRRNEGFKRHPKCDCTHVPVERSWAAPSPEQLLDRMTPAQREASLGKTNARAVAAGADPAQVVNARRGMSAPGDAERTHAARRPTTTESTSKRGAMPRQVRESPAALLRQHGEEPEALREALRANGYL